MDFFLLAKVNIVAESCQNCSVPCMKALNLEFPDSQLVPKASKLVNLFCQKCSRIRKMKTIWKLSGRRFKQSSWLAFGFNV